jgi:Prenyltransferase and squalene oxidase repeat
MSGWQGASLIMLGLVLMGGFAWYERSRPSSKVVVLVAALAALAVAGRLVLAPVPNVVATTDIVLISGYALGAAPGFAVGALAALVSNFWLGQGPWTPWQMAGWGMVGIGGAALAVLSGRRLGRVGLAAACGLAGIAYGALLDLSVMLTYGGEQSLDRYLALSARGVPFNVAHAAGNIAFALVAGPALVRLLQRFRARLEVRWQGVPASVAPLVALVVAGQLLGSSLDPPQAAGARSGEPAGVAPKAGAGAALGWLERARNPDGGYGAEPGGYSSVAMTGWAMLGLEAAGRNPLDLERGGSGPVTYLREHASAIRSTGDLERTVLALDAAGMQARDFEGHDLVAELRARRGADGSYQGQVNLTGFGILALRAAGVPASELRLSTEWLRAARNGDGGWGFRRDAPSDPDSTGAALQALAAVGDRGALGEGVAYLRRVQRPDGGFGLAETGVTNSQSTAWAVQGLLAAGTPPGAVRSSGHSPLDYLSARQAADGHYAYSNSSDQSPVWVTSQALLAVSGSPFPLAEAALEDASGAPAEPAIATSEPGAEPAGASEGEPRNASEEARRGEARRGVASGRDGADRDDRGADGRDALVGEVGSERGAGGGEVRDHEESGDSGGRGLTVMVAAGFGLLIAALATGFLWYRRTLP